MKQKEIYFDKAGATAFERSCTDAAERCNSLTEAFESFQDFEKITTLQSWIELVTSPGDYFDKVLLKNIEMKATGGKMPDPGILAKLFDIDRENYLNITSGKAIVESECKPCQKMKIKRGSTAISLSGYRQFESYLVFNSGHFTINEETIAQKQEDFKIFADTPARIEIVTFWNNLVNTLNQYHDRYHISDEDKRTIGKAMKLQLSEGVAGKFVVNNQALSLEIQITK